MANQDFLSGTYRNTYFYEGVGEGRVNTGPLGRKFLILRNKIRNLLKIGSNTDFLSFFRI